MPFLILMTACGSDSMSPAMFSSYEGTEAAQLISLEALHHWHGDTKKIEDDMHVLQQRFLLPPTQGSKRAFEKISGASVCGGELRATNINIRPADYNIAGTTIALHPLRSSYPIPVLSGAHSIVELRIVAEAPCSASLNFRVRDSVIADTNSAP